MSLKKNKIIVSCIGGIGDQIFQIGFGLSMMKKFNSSLTIDTSYYKSKLNYNKFNFYIDIGKLYKDIDKKENFYKINYSFVSYLRFFDFLKKIKLNYLYKIIIQTFFLRNIVSFIYEYKNRSSQEKFNSNCYYYGYWHNLNYIKEFRDLINSYLYKAYFQSKKIKEFKKNKIKKNTVSLHIRGGDFKYVKSHNPLESAYYEKAIKKIKKIVKKPIFHIYTNDVNHAKKILNNRLGSLETEYIYKYKYSTIEEFCLFSEYNYAIIANSTFSLMSSYLSKKRILSYGPLKWMKNKPLDKKKKFKKLILI